MKNRLKLWAAGGALALALVLLVSSSLAWFTVSTNPEIGGLDVLLYTGKTLQLSTDGVSFDRKIDLSEAFAGLAPLRPVSTLDGINWFIPTYDSRGVINDPSEFILDDELAYANMLLLDSEAVNLSGEGMKNQGYYVYGDFWMRTDEYGAKVRLSVPGISGVDENEEDEGLYGTYVLANYSGSTSGGSLSISASDKLSETSFRIGFLVDSDGDGDFTDETRFVIFEPNADRRSSADKPGSTKYDNTYFANDEEKVYVSGYSLNYTDLSQYSNGKYFVTQPIALGDDGKGHIADIDPDNLIIQTAGSWKTDTDALAASFAQTGNGMLNSNAVQSFGKFLDPGSYYIEGATPNAPTVLSGTEGVIAADNLVFELEQNVAVKVRLFIWIEGQDVDCWNDIAAGSVFVNLELAGETVEPPEPEPSPDPEASPEPES